MKLKLFIYGLMVCALSFAIYSCSKEHLELQQENAIFNTNYSRAIAADSFVMFTKDIEQLSIGESTTPVNTQRVDIVTYTYDTNHKYTVYLNIRYQYSENLKQTTILAYSVHLTGQTPLPKLSVDYVSIESIDFKRRFRVRVVGDLDLSPLTQSGHGGDVIPFDNMGVDVTL